MYFALNETLTKFQIFDQNHGLTPLVKMPILWVFVVQISCLLYKTSKIVYARFIFTTYDMGIHGVTRRYTGLQGVTEGYKGLQGMTGGDKGLRWVTKDYRNFSLSRTFPDTFS